VRLAPRLVAVLLAGPLIVACADDGEPVGPPTVSVTQTPTTPAPPASPTTTQVTPSAPAPEPRPRRLRGIDASHHQGVIDWEAVSGDGIAFAYLKASEGTTFTDPRFAENRERARDAGLRVGGYHYFSLCTPGAAQAAHFVAVLGPPTPRSLPPAVDLEVGGNCAAPPPRAELLAEVRIFVDDVEEALGVEPVVYLYPEFEDRYGFAADLTDHRQWVRSLDGPPDREWWMWQRSDSAVVAGIHGPADLNVLRRR